MFRQVIRRVAEEDAAKRNGGGDRGVEQRGVFETGGEDVEMPVPGDEPELRQIIEPLLPSDRTQQPDDDLVRDVLRQVRTYIGSENKRKNLLGRGFEDVLYGVLARLEDGAPANMDTQAPIDEIPGFRVPRAGDKSEKVDPGWARAKPAGSSPAQSGQSAPIAKSSCAATL